MPDAHYEDEKLAAIYDIDSPWSADRDFYLSLAGPERQNILDLGCGTGLICDAYAAKGHYVVGVDPSAAMLKVARNKPNGKEVDWKQSFAQDFACDTAFDLIIMTGHAFQVLIEDDDVFRTLSVMRKHIKPEGRIVFESRNPDLDWSKSWNYEMILELTDLRGGAPISVCETRNFLSWRDGCMDFELRYQFPDEDLVSTSTLRFMNRDEIEKQVFLANLKVHSLFGDWNRNTFEPLSSEEMIFTLVPA